MTERIELPKKIKSLILNSDLLNKSDLGEKLEVFASDYEGGSIFTSSDYVTGYLHALCEVHEFTSTLENDAPEQLSQIMSEVMNWLESL